MCSSDLFPSHDIGGWCLTDKFKERLQNGDKDAIKRWGEMLACKTSVGSGYQFFVDKANRQRPKAYVNNGLGYKNLSKGHFSFVGGN